MAILFSTLLISSWCTEVIGIHALFGAFLAGIVIPKNDEVQKPDHRRISDLTMVMLLAVIFCLYRTAYTGRNIEFSVRCGSALLIFCLCAVAGKFGGSALVARALGQTWKDSLSIGALMNTRGLMELVVLNIGYDMGILSTEIFSLMVLWLC